MERPGYGGVKEGMNKAKSAIENSLSTNLNFMEMKDIITKILSDPSLDLGYEYEPVDDPAVFNIEKEIAVSKRSNISLLNNFQ